MPVIFPKARRNQLRNSINSYRKAMAKILPLLAAIFFLSTSLLLKAGILLEGDQLAASLSQKLDSAVSAHSLFIQSIQQGRPTEEVVHSLDSFADEYSRFCAQLTQFCIWQKSHNGASNFSATGLTELAQFHRRSLEFGKALEGTPQLDEQFKPYILDPRIIAAEKRVISAYYAMESLVRQPSQ
jgi:hypothetical protein